MVNGSPVLAYVNTHSLEAVSARVSSSARAFLYVFGCEPLERRAGFGAETPTEIVLFCCLTKLCIIPPSMAVKKKTVQRSLDLAGNAEGAMTKYWAFARGGAWRNPKPTGGPYVCEQCRLDACGGNDATLTMQAVTTTELAPADVCADCEARLLEELEVKDRA